MSDQKRPSARTIRTKLRKAMSVGPGCKSRGRKSPTSRARRLEAQKRLQWWRRRLFVRRLALTVMAADRTAGRESCRTRSRLKPRRQREERERAEGTGPDW